MYYSFSFAAVALELVFAMLTVTIDQHAFIFDLKMHLTTLWCTFAGGDPSSLLASLAHSVKSPSRSAQVQPVATHQPSLDQLRAWEEEKEALRRYDT